MVASIVEHPRPITGLDQVTSRCKVRGEPYQRDDPTDTRSKCTLQESTTDTNRRVSVSADCSSFGWDRKVSPGEGLVPITERRGSDWPYLTSPPRRECRCLYLGTLYKWAFPAEKKVSSRRQLLFNMPPLLGKSTAKIKRVPGRRTRSFGGCVTVCSIAQSIIPY